MVGIPVSHKTVKRISNNRKKSMIRALMSIHHVFDYLDTLEIQPDGRFNYKDEGLITAAFVRVAWNKSAQGRAQFAKSVLSALIAKGGDEFFTVMEEVLREHNYQFTEEE